MGKAAPQNISFQITIARHTYDDLNGIVAAINEMRKETKEPQITRSQFIDTLINAFIVSHTLVKEEAEKEAKEENKNA